MSEDGERSSANRFRTPENGARTAPDACERAPDGFELVPNRAVRAHLADREWIAEDRLTLADLAVAASITSVPGAPLPLERYTHLRAFHARVSELPSYRASAV